MKRKKMYFDMEFTGLHQNTTLISIGVIADTGEMFYGECNDFDRKQCNDWIKKHVWANMLPDGAENWNRKLQFKDQLKKMVRQGDMEYIGKELKVWLSQFTFPMEFWSDVLAYDWVLMCELIADFSDGYPKLPDNVYYIPFDIATKLHDIGFDPDANREKLLDDEQLAKAVLDFPFDTPDEIPKHNALWDAIVIKYAEEKIDQALTYMTG